MSVQSDAQNPSQQQPPLPPPPQNAPGGPSGSGYWGPGPEPYQGPPPPWDPFNPAMKRTRGGEVPPMGGSVGGEGFGGSMGMGGPPPPPPMGWQGPPPGGPGFIRGGGGGGRGPGGPPGGGPGLFYRTKLCIKFKMGSCPNLENNCNFAHSMEELRRPPPGWEDYSGRDKGGGGGFVGNEGSGPGAGGGPPLPTQDGSQLGGKPKLCKKFFSEQGICPYGERCMFLHSTPSSGSHGQTLPQQHGAQALEGGEGVGGSGVGPTGKPANWRTRICIKWEEGSCPFGDKCHFAHGAHELQPFGGGTHADGPPPFGNSGNVNPLQASQTLGAATSKAELKTEGPKLKSPQVSDKRPISMVSNVDKRQNNVSYKWKGPKKGLSTVYGDWLEDLEWESVFQVSAVHT